MTMRFSKRFTNPPSPLMYYNFNWSRTKKAKIVEGKLLSRLKGAISEQSGPFGKIWPKSTGSSDEKEIFSTTTGVCEIGEIYAQAIGCQCQYNRSFHEIYASGFFENCKISSSHFLGVAVKPGRILWLPEDRSRVEFPGYLKAIHFQFHL